MKKFIKNFKSINNLFNKLLTDNLNKLNLLNLKNNKKNTVAQKRFFFSIIGLILICLFYLLLPSFYNREETIKKLETIVSKEHKINFELNESISYSFLPRPHFNFKKAIIKDDSEKISNIGELDIYISLKNLLNLNSLKILDIKASDSSIYLKKKNISDVFNFLKKKISINKFILSNSKVFFLNEKEDVLSIFKITKLTSFYDVENESNELKINGEVFGYRFDYDSQNNLLKNELNSSIAFKDLKLFLDTDIIFQDISTEGTIKLSTVGFNLINKIKMTNDKIFFSSNNDLGSRLFYKGQINLKPFNFLLDIKTNEIDLTNLISNESFFMEVLKSRLFFNKNLNFNISLYSNRIKQKNFNNLVLKSKFDQESLNLFGTRINLRDFAVLNLSNNQLLINKDNLFLNGEVEIIIENKDKFFSFFLVPKKLRKNLKVISIKYKYNLESSIFEIDNIEIDKKTIQDFNFLTKDINNLKGFKTNKIQLRKILNKLLESYDG